MAMLDACAATLSQAQRAALLAISRPDEFVKLRTIATSTAKHNVIRR